MVGRAKHRTKAQQRRFDAIKEIGCIICRDYGYPVPAEIHHIVDGYRKGHDYVLGLCCWHHRGEPWVIDTRPSEMEKIAGPSLARNKRAFIERFGSEDELLERQNELLSRYACDELAAQAQHLDMGY